MTAFDIRDAETGARIGRVHGRTLGHAMASRWPGAEYQCPAGRDGYEYRLPHGCHVVATPVLR